MTRSTKIRWALPALLVPALALGLFSLFGCGGDDQNDTPSGPPPRAAPTGALSFAVIDVAGSMGYTMRNRSGTSRAKNFIVEAMPPGIAVGDFNGDGWMDLYCPNGNQLGKWDPRARLIGFARPEEAPRNELYWNRGGKRFEPGGKAAGVDGSGWSFGAVAGDLDNDGDTDLFVCNWGLNRLYLNNGDGTFKEVAVQLGAAGDARGWSTGACLVDYDRDGDLDIFIAQYSDMHALFSDKSSVRQNADGTLDGRTCVWRGIKTYCGPLGLRPQNDVLLENRLQEEGGLRFKDVTRARGLYIPHNDRSGKENSTGPFYGFQPVAWDIDGDGWQDVFVANDSVLNQCWINRGGKQGFVDDAARMGLAMSSTDHTAQASMGVGVGDLNGDGLLDLVVTEFSHDQFNVLLAERLENGIVIFNEKAAHTGMRDVTFMKLGWGANVFDADLDGDNDIFFACGHVYPEVDDFPSLQTPYRQTNLLILNDGSRRLRLRDVSRDAGPGLAVRKPSRASATIDFDNDGDLDIATTELNESPCLLRFDLDPKHKHHWVAIRLKGDPKAQIPLDPAGAIVRVTAGGKTLTRVRLIGSTFQSSEDPRLHFGLGTATKVEKVEIQWPNGKTTFLSELPIDKVSVIVFPGPS